MKKRRLPPFMSTHDQHRLNVNMALDLLSGDTIKQPCSIFKGRINAHARLRPVARFLERVADAVEGKSVAAR